MRTSFFFWPFCCRLGGMKHLMQKEPSPTGINRAEKKINPDSYREKICLPAEATAQEGFHAHAISPPRI